MSSVTEVLNPLAAYEELMYFAKHRGEFALRLAMHAAVPQGIQPELLHLLKRNFIPEAGDDPALEADILFSPLCEEMGLGFFRFDPQVRALLLENLDSNYSAEPESRIAKVADFLIAYVDYHDRVTTGRQDQLWHDYLEVQRWVAFGFSDPAGAAHQFALALENANELDDFVARIQLGGLASALSAPLGRFPSLLNYAAGLQALELGDQKTANDLFESLPEEDLKIGTVTLRSASQVLDEWQARHPDYIAPPEPELAGVSPGVQELLTRLRSKNQRVRRQAAEKLGTAGAPEQAVPALIEALGDRNVATRLACVDALAQIRTETALIGLTKALANDRADVGNRALSLLREMGQRLSLIVGNFRERDEVLRAVQEAILSSGHLPVHFDSFGLSNQRFSDIAQEAQFAIVDVNETEVFFQELQRLLRFPIRVQPIAPSTKFSGIQQQYPMLLALITYEDADELRDVLGRRTPSLVAQRDPEHQKFEYDIFVSYASPDSRVVVPLVERLSAHLSSIMGRDLKVFHETALTVTPGVAYEEKLTKAIDQSATFLVIMSDSYLESNWSRRELARIAYVTTRDKSRIFKLPVHPISFEAQPSVLQYLPSYNFFNRDQILSGAAEDDPLHVETVKNLAQDIARVRSVQSLPPAELNQESTNFKSALQHEGIGTMAIQDEINAGQRRINFELCWVDSNVIGVLQSTIDILKAIAAIPAIAPHLSGVDFGKLEAAVDKAYRTSISVAEIKPPGCEAPPYPN